MKLKDEQTFFRGLLVILLGIGSVVSGVWLLSIGSKDVSDSIEWTDESGEVVTDESGETLELSE